MVAALQDGVLFETGARRAAALAALVHARLAENVLALQLDIVSHHPVAALTSVLFRVHVTRILCIRLRGWASLHSGWNRL